MDKTGNLWFGTQGGGVSRYDGNRVEAIERGDTIAQRTQQDLKKINGKLVKSFTNFTTAQGLANNTVLSITEDKTGNLWFGTDGGGVSRYDGNRVEAIERGDTIAQRTQQDLKKINGKLVKSFTNFTTAQGLPDDVVTQVVIDSQQNIVIGTNFGVGVVVSFTPKLREENTKSNIPAQNSLNNEELKNYTPNIEIYNSSTGYPVKDVNAGQNAMYKDSKGIIWIATGSAKTGLVRFDYNAVNKNTNPPAVFIQSVKINDENIVWYNLMQSSKFNLDSNTTAPNITEEVNAFGKILGEADRDSMRTKFRNVKFDGITKWYPLPENLILTYEHNSVTFDFNAIETSRNFLVRYQYILEGYDKDWSPLTEKTSATFGNIYEGNYTFKLKAQSPFGIWSAPIEYKFKVLPPWWRTWWMYALYVVSALLLIGGFIKWRERNLKREKIVLEEKVELRTKQLDERNKVVEEQNKIVEEKNKEITDSINYALRIQQAILPDKKEISSSFPQSFVLFKPKDIVSGDFYFFHKNEESVCIAAADCTGHGVPGALMSMVGSERLTDAVQQSNNTSEILSLLNNGIKKSLKQSSSDESTRDGMDIALCSVDTVNRIVKYAGSNRPIYIIRRGQTEVEEIKATKKAIGGFTENDQHFDTHELKLNKGDTFYLSTDGYADTFSGKDSKKLTTRKFKQILLDIQHKSMQEQEQHLENFIEDWKAGTEQVDDILVIGIRM